MDISSIIPLVEKFYLRYGLPTIFVSSFIEITPFGWTVPGGAMLAIGGFFSYQKPLYLFGVVIFGWFGAWLSLVFAYYFGATLGTKLIVKLNQKDRADKAEKLLEIHGASILVTSMLANLTRFWIAFIAGIKGFHFTKFVFYSGVTSFVWTIIVVTVGYLVGAGRGTLETGLAKIGVLAWLLLLFALFVVFKKSKNGFGTKYDK